MGIGVYTKEEGTAPSANITNLRLSLDNDARQPIRGRYDHFVDWLIQNMDPMRLDARLMLSDAATKHPMMWPIYDFCAEALGVTWATGATDGVQYAISGTPADDTVTFAGTKITSAKAGVVPTALAAMSLNDAYASFFGWPYNMLYFPIGDRYELSDILMPSEWGDGAMILTQGNAGAYCGVIVEELRA